jgi:hypothetical protein
MKIRAITYQLPAQYASYLVSSNPSVFDPAVNPDGEREWSELDQWCRSNGVISGCVTIAKGSNGETMEPYFMHGPIGPQCEGGDALDFEFSYEELADHE